MDNKNNPYESMFFNSINARPNRVEDVYVDITSKHYGRKRAQSTDGRKRKNKLIKSMQDFYKDKKVETFDDIYKAHSIHLYS